MSAVSRINTFCFRASFLFKSYEWKWGYTASGGPDTVPQEVDLIATAHQLYGSCLVSLRDDDSLNYARSATGRIVCTVFRSSENFPEFSLVITD